MRRFGLAILLVFAGVSSWAEVFPPVTVYVPKVCLACLEWAEHLRENGFHVTIDDSQDMEAIKRRWQVPSEYASRHTAVVAGYFIEGHVPAADIKMLLREKPKARGLAVPGLPRGAPGLDKLEGTGCETGCVILEGEGTTARVRRQLFETWLIDRKGKARIWARH
ncbi:MAG: metal-binding protein [Rhodocyclaceae bacterium]|nr:metal-binding protein [Rhodocyclaceae bacterium]